MQVLQAASTVSQLPVPRSFRPALAGRAQRQAGRRRRLPHSLDLTETLHQTWADFATGKEGLGPAYDTDTRQIMSYAHNNHDSAHQVVQDPRGSERKWWDGHPATTWPAKPNQLPHLTSSAAEDAVTNRSECGKSLCALVSNM